MTAWMARSSSPLRTTRQSEVCGDFPAAHEYPRLAGLSRSRWVSTIGQLDFGARFGASVSGPKISFPGIGDGLPGSVFVGRDAVRMALLASSP
jgi:hypothetical protein